MKQRTKKRCFMIIALSLAVLLILSGCGIKGAIAGVDLTPYKEAADGGRLVYIDMVSCCGTGEGADYDSVGLRGTARSKDLLNALVNLKTEKSAFAVPNSFEKGEFFYEVIIDGLDFDNARDRVYYRFYNEFKQVSITKGNKSIGVWEVQNPDVIKDLFVKYEMYQKKL